MASTSPSTARSAQTSTGDGTRRGAGVVRRLAGRDRPVETWVAAFEQLIDSVNGHINFDLFLPIRVLGMGPDTWQSGDRFPVRVNIVDGEVNFAEIEDAATGGILDPLIDFEVKDDRLVVELDLSKSAGRIGAPHRHPGPRRLGPDHDQRDTGERGQPRRLGRLLVPLRNAPTPGGVAEIDFGAMAL